MSEKIKQLAKIVDNLGIAAIGVVATRSFLIYSENKDLVPLIAPMALAAVFYVIMQLIAIKFLDLIDNKPKSPSPMYTVENPATKKEE